jgi:YD repeat-containing protein
MRFAEYDVAGRLVSSEQATDGQVYPSSYGYNLAGMLVEQTYPSGRVVKNVLDASGDISIIRSRKDANSGYWNYAQSIEYTPSGVIKHLRLGNGLWESAVMNSRNQVLQLRMGNSPTDGSLMHLTYDYGEFDQNGNVDVAKNAGNIVRQTINSGLANPFVQNYKYDPLDRITEAKETVNGSQTWIQQFGYDRYGNRTSLAETVHGQAKTINEITLPSIDANTNRFSSTTDYEFDAVGNLIRDAHGRQFVFDGDNKQVEVKDDQDVTIGEYIYDGNG